VKNNNKTYILLAAAAGAGVFFYSQYKKAKNISFEFGQISNFKISLLNNEITFNSMLGLKNTTDLKIKLQNLTGAIYAQNVYISNYNLLSNLEIPAGSTEFLNIAFVLPLSSLLVASGGVVQAVQAGESINLNIVYRAATNYGVIEDSIKFST
jgi:LEA14-like dessication related protein